MCAFQHFSALLKYAKIHIFFERRIVFAYIFSNILVFCIHREKST